LVCRTAIHTAILLLQLVKDGTIMIETELAYLQYRARCMRYTAAGLPYKKHKGAANNIEPWGQGSTNGDKGWCYISIGLVF
jgi:hypothetical protein